MNAVELRDAGDGIFQITLQEREHKNTFSAALVGGLTDAFRAVRANPACKVVVLTGYDSYFACGATQDGLLRLHEGKVKFTQVGIYREPLDCPVPVIAAMQGHAIGGGFVLGLFADFAVLSRESLYSLNFMKYGFTPGMGATFVVPQKFGTVLGHELLMTARSYRGADLEKRGVPYPVLPRAEVLPQAYALARELAEKPRVSLITLKNHLVARTRQELADWAEAEVAMHETTFHQPEVRERITQLFGR